MFSERFKYLVKINKIFRDVDSGKDDQQTINNIKEIIQQFYKDVTDEEVKIFIKILHLGHLYKVENGIYCRVCEKLCFIDDLLICKINALQKVKQLFLIRR